MSEILVVDDSLTVRMDLAGALEAAGFTVVACATLAEARRALAERPIALAVLDVRLPDGDGVELLAEMRHDPGRASLPVIMLSSEAEVADRIRGLRTGANDYVGKPYDAEFVIARIRQLIAAPQGGAPLVLIIDDSPTFREVLAAELAAAGYATATASSGHEGLRLANARRPDAIIVDGVMPDMNGDQVIRRLRLDAALRAIPCLLLTGSETAASEVRALDAGADAFVRKDGDAEAILARFAAMLRSAPSAPGESGNHLGSKRILAVDDSPSYLHAIAEQLQADGFDVVQASSGAQAIELLAVQPVDCVVLDVVMPGMTGIEVCRRIKAAPAVRDTPVIAVTSNDGRDTMLEALAAGADDFVSKAAGGEVLGARVMAQIRRKRVADEYRHVRERLLRSEHEAAEARAARELAETRAAMAEQLAYANAELARANQELEAFSYSVSHDLRAPLRTIQGFSRILVEDFGPALPEEARTHLDRIMRGTARMSALIDDLLELSRVGRAALRRQRVDLTALAAQVLDDLRKAEPSREVELAIDPGLTVEADFRLLQIVLENLLGNAWKFTARTAAPRIEVGAYDRGGERIFFVRDNGAGFDMQHADRLFAPFQRLHTDKDFPGTGIGLATVHRIIMRHGGRITVTARPGDGATFELTFGPRADQA